MNDINDRWDMMAPPPPGSQPAESANDRLARENSALRSRVAAMTVQMESLRSQITVLTAHLNIAQSAQQNAQTVTTGTPGPEPGPQPYIPLCHINMDILDIPMAIWGRLPVWLRGVFHRRNLAFLLFVPVLVSIVIFSAARSLKACQTENNDRTYLKGNIGQAKRIQRIDRDEAIKLISASKDYLDAEAANFDPIELKIAQAQINKALKLLADSKDIDLDQYDMEIKRKSWEESVLLWIVAAVASIFALIYINCEHPFSFTHTP